MEEATSKAERAGRRRREKETRRRGAEREGGSGEEATRRRATQCKMQQIMIHPNITNLRYNFDNHTQHFYTKGKL